MIKHTLCFAAAIFMGSTSAANKCTGADGKVTYQDAPCTAGSRAATVDIQPSQSDLEMESSRRWRSSRERDPMTNEVTCFAISPMIGVSTGYREMTSVYLQFAAIPKSGATALTIRSLPGGAAGIFHTDMRGMGAKTDNGAFTPITRKISQNALAFEQSTPPEFFANLEKATELRFRLRFWPYDELRDTRPIPMKGAKQAIEAAMQCAATP